MNDLIENMFNGEGKMTCNRCENSFVVYFDDSNDVEFCPSCGVVMSPTNVTYASDEEN